MDNTDQMDKEINTVCPHCGSQGFLQADVILINLLACNGIQEPVSYPCEACQRAYNEEYVSRKDTTLQKIFMKTVWIAIGLVPVGIYLGFFANFWDDTTNLWVFAGCWAAVPAVIIIGLITKRFGTASDYPARNFYDYYGNPFFSDDRWNIWHRDR